MDNPEVQAALKAGIPVIPRAIMLAELMRTKFGVAVAGSHGKTTTTSMISHLLDQAELDPTIVIGGVLKNLSTHARLGNGDLLIAEADESDRSLLYLNPSIAIVTNIDAEHLDTYKDLDDVKETFKNFLARLPFYGKAIVCIDDPNIRTILPLEHISTIKYGFNNAAQIRGNIKELAPKHTKFEVWEKENLLGEVTLYMPGEHNVLNSLAAIALGLELEVSFELIKNALESFKGVERRFEFKGFCNGAEIFDDYGHHPTEIQKTLLVAKRRAKSKLHVVFQPHRYTRTEKLWDDFVDVFAYADIDTLFLTDIYPASEDPIESVTSERLAQEIQRQNPNLTIYYYPTYDQIAQQAEKVLSDGDLFITIGAGKANYVGKVLVDKG
jgi:UDP-N-acetylmuramate--alanine ligase